MAKHSCINKKMVRVDLLTVHTAPDAPQVIGAALGTAVGALVGAALGIAVGAAVGAAGTPPFLAFSGSGALEGLAGAGALVMAALESIRTGTRVKVMNFMMTVLIWVRCISMF